MCVILIMGATRCACPVFFSKDRSMCLRDCDVGPGSTLRTGPAEAGSSACNPSPGSSLAAAWVHEPDMGMRKVFSIVYFYDIPYMIYFVGQMEGKFWEVICGMHAWGHTPHGSCFFFGLLNLNPLYILNQKSNLCFFKTTFEYVLVRFLNLTKFHLLKLHRNEL